MPDRKEGFDLLVEWPWPVGIDAGTIGHIVTLFLQPAHHVVFPPWTLSLIDHHKKFSGPTPIGEVGIAWQRVRTVERDVRGPRTVRTARKGVTAARLTSGVRVDRIPAPGVIRLVGGNAALKQKV